MCVFFRSNRYASNPGRAFTLIELLVVISIIALLIAILLPALGAARKAARKMKSDTQLRGIHQGMVAYAQDNGGYFPGLSSNGEILKPAQTPMAGGHYSHAVQERYFYLLNENYFSGKYIISPAEQLTAWTEGDDRVNPENYSYAMLSLSRNSKKRQGSKGRFNEWRQTLNSQAVMLGDRTRSGATYYSLWTSARPYRNWKGGVTWNDNHVTFESDYFVRTQYAGGAVEPKDRLFDFLGTQKSPLQKHGYNAYLAAKNYTTKTMPRDP